MVPMYHTSPNDALCFLIRVSERVVASISDCQPLPAYIISSTGTTKHLTPARG